MIGPSKGGEVEITHTSVVDRLTIPILTAATCAAVADITLVVIVIIRAVWLLKARGWKPMIDVIWYGNWTIVAFSLGLAAWPAAGMILVAFNMLPKLLNDNWPPPWAQAQVGETGAFTFWNALMLRLKPNRPEPEPTVERINIMLTKKTHNGSQSQMISLPGHPALPAFALAVLGGLSFTEEHAKRKPYRIYRKDFYAIRDALLARKALVWKNPKNHRLGVRLAGPEDDGYEAGKAVMEALAGQGDK